MALGPFRAASCSHWSLPQTQSSRDLLAPQLSEKPLHRNDYYLGGKINSTQYGKQLLRSYWCAQKLLLCEVASGNIPSRFIPFQVFLELSSP